MHSAFMGVDIGTSGVRSVLFNSAGEQIHIVSMEYPIVTPHNGWAELEPEKVFQFTLTTIGQCVYYAKEQKYEVAGIGLSCQMHSLIAVDQNGEPLTGAMLWADVRAQDEAEFLRKNYDTSSLYYTTGCRVDHPMYPICKVLWLKNKQPETFKNTSRFITLNEYIVFKLFGQYLVDYSLAGCQGFFNVHTLKWEESITKDILKISPYQLSQPVECTTQLTRMRTSYANQMGISEATPFVIGGGDGILANVGSGIFTSGAFSTTIGTSGAIRTTSESCLLSPGRKTWCYPFTRNLWVAGGAINNGGLVLRWLKGSFYQEFSSDAVKNGCSIYQLFDKYTHETAPGSDGLIFLPYLTGERCPDWNASARGIMYGLSLVHSKKHIVRASMEGILYRFYSVYESLRILNPRASSIIASGGYTKSKVWLKMQADLFNKEIKVLPVAETSALGAAYLAMLASKSVESMGKLLPVMTSAESIKPNPEVHQIYEKLYEQAMNVYHKLYPVNS